MNSVEVRRWGTWLRGSGTALLLTLAFGALTVHEAQAQRAGGDGPQPIRVIDADTPHPDDVLVTSPSPFQLRGQADLAYAGNRGRGTQRMKLNNVGIAEHYFIGGGAQWLQLGAPSGTSQILFQGSLYLAAPRSEWAKYRNEPGLESLQNVTGGGWNAVRTITHTSLYQTESWLPGDDQLGRVHSGARTTTDGACTDFSVYQVSSGFSALASSDCEPTWGSEQFAGATRSIPQNEWIRYFNDVGPENFNWEWWRVPDEYKSNELMGDFQIYSKIIDWGTERRQRMGSVMPGGAGAPTERGWPMGISVQFDAFTFELPTMANTTFWQALIINESEQVWGQQLHYDSLYMGMMHGVLMSLQNAAEYYRPDIGGVIISNNRFNPNCNDARVIAGRTTICSTGGASGDGQGVAAILILNSPLGDLRNKHFSNPESPFFAPTHPHAGDTITFNIGRMCGFGAPCWGQTSDRSPRASFGYVAGVLDDLLDGRTASDITATNAFAWYRIFRNHDFPEETPRWNQWVPGDWDWNKDGNPDTISVPTCLGPEFGGPATGYPCSEIMSDTLPGRLINGGNNIGGLIGFGPFPLAAGDTARFTVAMVSGPNFPAFEANLNNTLAFYQANFLRPSAPPAPGVVSVSTTPGDRGRTPGARVTIFLDDSPEEFVDEFLLFQADQFEGSQLAADNPWLVDSLRTVAHNNLAALRVYKSCNAGTTFTATANCFGNPAVDDAGQSVGLGWRFLQRFEVDAEGRVPNVFTDGSVTAGQRYLYVFVAESRGFSADVLARDPDTGELVPQRLELAPPLTNPLSISVADRNVVSVYVPASRQAGGRPAEVAFVADDPRTPSEFHPVAVTLTGDDVPAGQYRLVFGDSVVVEQHRTGENTIEAFVALYRTIFTSDDDGATRQRTVIEEISFATGVTPDGVTTAGGETTGSLDEVGGVQTTVFTGLTMVVAHADGRPLLVTSTLTGAGATPGTFFGRTDFPGFIVSLNAAQGGTFVAQAWMEPSADTAIVLRAAGAPTLRWITGGAASTGHQFGEYRLDWQGSEFGPARLFRLNLINPQETQAAFTQSLNTRATATQTVATEAVAAAIRATAGDEAFDDILPEDLAVVDVPFTLRNATTGRNAVLAMRADAKRDSVLLGAGAQTLWLQVPANKWVPGEPLIVLEQVTRFRTALTAGGDPYVVTDPVTGAPEVHDSLMVTWRSIMIACDAAPSTCNPLQPGSPGQVGTSHLAVTPGSEFLRVRYRNPFTPQSQFTFEVTPAITGGRVTAVTQFDLDDIKVVPNPYIIFSRYERDPQDRRLMFMGLPPRGTVEIYTVAGQFVQRIRYDEQDLAGNGDLFWNMRTHENNDIASGLYLFVVDGTLPATGQRVRKTGKFVVIRGS